MSWTFGLLVSALALFVSTALMVALFSRLLLAPISNLLAHFAPATRAQLWLLWSSLPFFFGLMIVVLALSPSFFHPLGLSLDHCQTHTHHLHLCLYHTPLFVGIGEKICFAVILLWGLWLFSRFAWHTYQTQRYINTLYALSGKKGEGYHIIPAPQAFALTIGWLQSRIFLSQTLVDLLSSAELATVLNHERQHQQQHDGLRLLWVSVLSYFHCPMLRRIILKQFSLSIEQACDEAAAQQNGDRLQVAETIVKVSRLIRQPPLNSPYALSVASSSIRLRVQGLLSPCLPTYPKLGSQLMSLIAITLLLNLIAGNWWHHSAETLLLLLLG